MKFFLVLMAILMWFVLSAMCTAGSAYLTFKDKCDRQHGYVVYQDISDMHCVTLDDSPDR